MFKDINKRYTKKSIVNKGSNLTPIRDLSVKFGFDYSNTLQSDSALISAFSSTPDVYGVINYLANAKSKVKVKMKNSKGEIITEHPILDLINKPNYYQSRSEFLKQGFAYEYVTGNSFINFMDIAGFKPEEMFNLPPDKTQIVTEKKTNNTDFRINKIKGYHFISSPTTSSIIAKENVMHINRINLDCSNGNYIRGMSPLLSAKMPINSLMHAYEAQMSIFSNRGAMGVLTPKFVEMPVNDNDKKQIISDYYASYGLGSEQSKIMISPVPVDYTQMGMPISELQINETNLANFEAVCVALNINATLLRNTGASTRDNVKMFETQLWANNLVPELNDFWNNMELSLKTFWKEDFTLCPDYSTIEALRKDDKTLAETRKINIASGIITPNEARIEAGLEASNLAEMDMYYLQTNLTSIVPKETTE